MYYSFNYRSTAEIFFAAAVLITTPLVIYGIFFNYASLWLTCTIFGPLDFIFFLVAVACWEIDEHHSMNDTELQKLLNLLDRCEKCEHTMTCWYDWDLGVWSAKELKCEDIRKALENNGKEKNDNVENR